MDYSDIEGFALEIKRDHSVIFETAPKHCILDSFVDYEDDSISSKGFLSTIVDIMVQFSSVTQSCPTLCDPMNCITPGLPEDVLFIIGDWNAKVGSQEIPGIKGKFGLGVQNEAGQRLTEFCQENTMVIANLFQQHNRLHT